MNQKEEAVNVQNVDKVDEEEFVQEPVMGEEKLANSKQQSESEGDALPPPPDFHSLLQSVSDLEKLHGALSKFLREWKYLKGSIESINVAIDAHASFQQDALSPEQEKDERSEQAKETDERSELAKEKDERSEQAKEKDERSEQAKEKDERSELAKEKDERSRIEIICDDMDGKSLRRYVESNLSDIDLLRDEVPEALRRIPNPEELVFVAVGKFYTQGRRAYNYGSQLISIRRAGILLLEFLVLSGRPTGDSSVKEKAMDGALLWWKRLVSEKIDSATAEDSCGLVLYLACFGIPKNFDSEDLCILFKKSNLKKNIDVFRRSNILVARIPGVLDDLIKARMYFEVAELSCYFGLTETFSPLPLLSSFAAKVIHTGNFERKRSQDSAFSAKEANTRELKTLKSVVEFLEEHKLDAHDLSSVNIHKEIAKLEKYIEEDEKRSREKRILKRKSPHSIADEKPETRFRESHPPPASRTPRRTPSLPPFPGSNSENPLLSAAVSNSREYSYDWGRRYPILPAGYESSAMNYFRAPLFYQSQASSVYENGKGISGRNVYQFVDNFIEREERRSKSYRSSNSSPGGAGLGLY
ncbi:protein FRIGIDA-like [Phalaenopsis equestris]|uniref:protein FRIGIDA-like n=1 Tax=Phalaenopsis equestris TaxID=78828 RepID=UPI0009E550E6|nr:protein FRIGIDA-like [Phalaenopsis equestris]